MDRRRALACVGGGVAAAGCAGVRPVLGADTSSENRGPPAAAQTLEAVLDGLGRRNPAALERHLHDRVWLVLSNGPASPLRLDGDALDLPHEPVSSRVGKGAVSRMLSQLGLGFRHDALARAIAVREDVSGEATVGWAAARCDSPNPDAYLTQAYVLAAVQGGSIRGLVLLLLPWESVVPGVLAGEPVYWESESALVDDRRGPFSQRLARAAGRVAAELSLRRLPAGPPVVDAPGAPPLDAPSASTETPGQPRRRSLPLPRYEPDADRLPWPLIAGGMGLAALAASAARFR